MTLYNEKIRNKRGDITAIFERPMTMEKYQALSAITKKSKRFEIELPNGYRLKFGEHLNILKQNPKRFGDYVKIAYSRYYAN